MRTMLVLATLLGAFGGITTQAPLSWVTGERLALADPDAQALGTIWDGSIAHIDGLPPVRTRLEGRQVILTASGPQLDMQGIAAPGRLSDIALSLPVASLARFDPRLSGLGGDVSLTVDELIFDGARCASASGQASTDVLAVNTTSWRWQGPPLSGPISCEEGDVLIAMDGQDASGSVEARIRISPAGPYRTEVTVQTSDPAAGAVLPLFGFDASGTNRWRLNESGAWQ